MNAHPPAAWIEQKFKSPQNSKRSKGCCTISGSGSGSLIMPTHAGAVPCVAVGPLPSGAPTCVGLHSDHNHSSTSVPIPLQLTCNSRSLLLLIEAWCSAAAAVACIWRQKALLHAAASAQTCLHLLPRRAQARPGWHGWRGLEQAGPCRKSACWRAALRAASAMHTARV